MFQIAGFVQVEETTRTMTIFGTIAYARDANLSETVESVMKLSK